MNPIVILIDVLVLIVGIVAGYFFHRYRIDQQRKNQQEKADTILKGANEQARLINALKITQAAESEIKERRIELNKETDRLDKRRSELDKRSDRLEQREQTLNKRQSQMDRRGNEIGESFHRVFS